MSNDVDLSIRKTGRKPSCTCGICKQCTWAAYMRAYYQSKTPEERHRLFVAGRNPERVAAHEKARAVTPERRATLKRSQLRHPEKEHARKTLRAAIKRGKVHREPCFCGATKSEGHHPDYSKPLEVVWLCRKHHVEAHGRVSHQ